MGIRIWIAGLCGLLSMSAFADSTQPAIDSDDLALRIHKRINLERRKHKLPELAWDARLAAIATSHSRDMARRHVLSHASADGRDFDQRYRQAGYQCEIRVGRLIHVGAENIALSRLYNSSHRTNKVMSYDWNSPEDIARKTVEGWMQSPGHRENILTRHWHREGIGVQIEQDNRVLITQNFC